MPTAFAVPRDWLELIRALAQRPVVLALSAAAALSGAALTRLPLVGVPGWELATLLCASVTVVGGAAGIASARLLRDQPPERWVLPATGAALLYCLVVLVVPLLAAIAGTLAATPCDPWRGIPFWAVLPVPTAALACATGTALGALFQRAWVAGLAFAAVVLGTLGLSLWPLWDGPQVFALNHFLGVFPGPLYDEALAVDGRLLAYRALTLAWLGAVLGATAAFVDPRGGLRRRSASTAGAAALVLGAIVIVAMGMARFELGLETSELDLARTLPGTRQTAHAALHFPPAKSALEIDRLERDVEYHLDQLARRIGPGPAGRIHVWLHESTTRKRELVGASQTSFAKPWRLEIHLVDQPFPHPVLRHELAHAFAAAFGSPVFRVSARRVVLLNAGLVEGLAVALDERADEATLHESAAAMRRLALAPDVRAIVGPAGFWKESPARAYDLAGSFLRFLIETRGAAGVRRLYATGDFQGALGRDLDALADEWEAFLDALPLDARALDAAAVRFGRGSLFARPCAREVAHLEAEAARLKDSDPNASLEIWARCARIDPASPGAIRGRVQILQARGDLEAAARAWENFAALPGLSTATRSQALLALGDLAWTRGDLARARDLFDQARDLHRDRPTGRATALRLEALADPDAEQAFRDYFTRGADEASMRELGAIPRDRPTWVAAEYLVGRQLVQRGRPRSALPHLLEAIARHDEPLVRIEALRLLATAIYRMGGACEWIDGLAPTTRQPAAAADRDVLATWSARCRFEKSRFGGSLADPERP